MSGSVVVIPKCHPKLTETFIAQGVHALKVRDPRTRVYSPYVLAFRARLSTQGQRPEDENLLRIHASHRSPLVIQLADQEVV